MSTLVVIKLIKMYKKKCKTTLKNSNQLFNLEVEIQHRSQVRLRHYSHLLVHCCQAIIKEANNIGTL